MSKIPYIDNDTGNTVKVIQCGHPGSLIMESGFMPFQEGDYIVTFPIGFDGIERSSVFSPIEFKRRFKTVQGQVITWDNWIEHAEIVPKRRRVVR